MNEDYGKNCSSLEGNCTYLALNGCSFKSNAALAGGAIFAAYSKALRYKCEPFETGSGIDPFNDEILSAMKPLKSINHLCRSWVGNEAVAFGPFIASYPRDIQTFSVTWENNWDHKKPVDMESHAIDDYQSGRVFPTIEIRLVDELGQGPAYGLGNGTILAVLECELLAANVYAAFLNGTASIRGVRGYGKTGVYNLTISFDPPFLKSLSFNVTIQPCRIGEKVSYNEKHCHPCSDEEYNFNSTAKQCQRCSPKAMDCSTQGINPAAGYFNWNPCSTHVQRCLSRAACDFDTRRKEFHLFMEDVENCSFTEKQIERYHEVQCDQVIAFAAFEASVFCRVTKVLFVDRAKKDTAEQKIQNA